MKFKNLEEEFENEILTRGNLSRAPSPERTFLFREMLARLSKEAQEVVSIVFDTPSELIEMTMGREPGINKNNLTKYLRTQGWKYPAIKNAFSQIISGLKELE